MNINRIAVELQPYISAANKKSASVLVNLDWLHSIIEAVSMPEAGNAETGPFFQVNVLSDTIFNRRWLPFSFSLGKEGQPVLI